MGTRSFVGRLSMRMVVLLVLLFASSLFAQRKKDAAPWVTPALPDGKLVATDMSDAFLKAISTLKPGVAVAKAAPTIDFLFSPGQTAPRATRTPWRDGRA